MSLENELLNSTSKNDEELKDKIKKLEHKLERFAEKELFEKKERIKLFKKMEIVSESRKSNLENFKQSVMKLKENNNATCWYGIKCRRLFCKFNHEHVFKKVKQVAQNLKMKTMFSKIICVIDVDKCFTVKNPA